MAQLPTQPLGESNAQERSELNEKWKLLSQDINSSLSRIGLLVPKQKQTPSPRTAKNILLEMIAKLQEMRDNFSTATAEKVSDCCNDAVEALQNLDKAPSNICHEVFIKINLS